MDPDALDRIVAAIEELERLFEQAKDDPSSPAWLQMQRRPDEMQQQVERLKPH